MAELIYRISRMVDGELRVLRGEGEPNPEAGIPATVADTTVGTLLVPKGGPRIPAGAQIRETFEGILEIEFVDDRGRRHPGSEAQRMKELYDEHIPPYGIPNFFKARGVDPEIMAARPYDQWTPDEPKPLQEAWFPHIKATQRGWVTKIAKQAPGHIIKRHAPPGIGASAISAEIRPFYALETEPNNEAKYVHCPGKGEATRLDVDPRAVSLFEDATRVFFGIEGCIKADAILSQGEAVFSVPAVWQWDAPEMPTFIDRYLKGKTVYIVPDADWHHNWRVITPAIQCRAAMRALGVKHVFIAAPPVDAGLKGVDDFLGAGKTVDDLVVIGREMPEAFEEWAAREAIRSRLDGASRDAEVLQALALTAGLLTTDDGERVEREGEIHKSVKPLARTITAINPKRVMRPKSVREALESLERRPGLTSHRAITVSGSLNTLEAGTEFAVRGRASDEEAHGWWGASFPREFDFKNRPVITIAPELRAQDQAPIRVGDLGSELAIRRLTPFLHRDVSPERLEHLRGSLAA